jgi:hypothetical protein
MVDQLLAELYEWAKKYGLPTKVGKSKKNVPQGWVHIGKKIGVEPLAASNKWNNIVTRDLKTAMDKAYAVLIERLPQLADDEVDATDPELSKEDHAAATKNLVELWTSKIGKPEGAVSSIVFDDSFKFPQSVIDTLATIQQDDRWTQMYNQIVSIQQAATAVKDEKGKKSDDEEEDEDGEGEEITDPRDKVAADEAVQKVKKAVQNTAGNRKRKESAKTPKEKGVKERLVEVIEKTLEKPSASSRIEGAFPTVQAFIDRLGCNKDEVTALQGLLKDPLDLVTLSRTELEKANIRAKVIKKMEYLLKELSVSIDV